MSAKAQLRRFSLMVPPTKLKNQSSYRAEVRALAAALEKTEGAIDVITDNRYVRDTAQYIETG
eukprot:9579333-Heterocapsa_arctica.AAC.1